MERGNGTGKQGQTGRQRDEPEEERANHKGRPKNERLPAGAVWGG